MMVARQKGNPDKTIASLAAEIVQKWKKVVEAEKAKRQKMNGSIAAKKGSTSSPASSQAATPIPASATPASAAKGYNGDPALRRWTTDGLKMEIIGSTSRDNCVGLIYNGLAFVS